MTKDPNLLGKTVIFTVSQAKYDGDALEGKINAYSPKGDYVLIDHNWYERDKVTIKDELPAPGWKSTPAYTIWRTWPR